MNEKNKFYFLRINNAVKIFEKRGFSAHYFETSVAAVDYFFSAINKKMVIGYGGSRTVSDLMILEKLRTDGFILLDRNREGISKEEKDRFERECFSADVFIASANAVSEEGSIVNMDMWGNRTGAISFGPKKVYLFIGRNKLECDFSTAIQRARNYASVLNAIRFNTNTPCSKNGTCSNCFSQDRICGTLSIIEWCFPEKRIELLFFNEDFGF